MEDLVEVVKGEMLVSSHLVARKFGVQHHQLMNVVRRVIVKLEALDGDLPKYYASTRTYRGTTFEVYLMSREFFSLVAMRLKTPAAFEWQVKFNEAFYQMESSLLQAQTNKDDMEWNASRLIGKTARKEETDAIKDFVEYATKQGSKSASFYYKHITNASYKALNLMARKHPKLRDEMNLYQLSELMLAERMAATKLKEYMARGRHYKDIYTSVRDDLLSFSDAIRVLDTKQID